MAILSIGYDGTVDEKQWAKIHASTASVYGVSTASSWKVSAVAGSDRTVSIAPGSGWGHHIYDESDANVTLQGDTVASGSRWDMVVLRRDWGPIGGGPSFFRLIKGTSIKMLPARANDPGVLDEQPLALVQFSAGQTQPTAIIDLRCWASSGGAEVVDVLALNYLGTPGAAIKLGKAVRYYESQGNGVWGWSTDETPWIDLTLGATAGIGGVRGAGNWVRVGASPAQVRLVANGTMLQVRGELNYVNTSAPDYMPAEGWAVAKLPPGVPAPTADAYVTGTSDTYRKSQVYIVQANRDIIIGPGFAGKLAQFNGVAPL